MLYIDEWLMVTVRLPLAYVLDLKIFTSNYHDQNVNTEGLVTNDDQRAMSPLRLPLISGYDNLATSGSQGHAKLKYRYLTHKT